MKKVMMLGLVVGVSMFAKTELSMSIGTNSFSSSENVKNSTSYGIRGDFYLDNLYHIDLGYDRFDSVKTKTTPSVKFKIDRFYTQFSADGEEEYHIVPTLSVGAGVEKAKARGDSSSQGFLSLGVGFRYNISQNFNFLLGTKVLWKTKSRNLNYHTTVGMGYMIDDEPANNEKESVEEVVIPKEKLSIPQKVKPQVIPEATIQTTDVKVQSVRVEPSKIEAKTITQARPCYTSKPTNLHPKRQVLHTRGTFIQVGAYTRNKPTYMLNRLSKNGYHIILRHLDHITKALVGPFESEIEARRILKDVRKFSKGAFIYKGN